MTTRVFIDGAAGTTGLEIRDRLADRAEFELLVLDDAQRKDETARQDALHEAEVAILCLPDAAAREAVALAEGSTTRIIDASSAHRTDDGWIYGFPEMVDFERDIRNRDLIAEADRVSNPGCYPTGAIALLQPLIEDGCLPRDWPYSIHAVSGFSGGGNTLIDRFEADPDIAIRTYGLSGGHKHLREIQKFAAPGGLSHQPVFSPSVIPAHRGMIVEIPLNLAAMGSSTSTPKGLHMSLSDFNGFYNDIGTIVPDEPVIAVTDPAEYPDELVIRADAAAWDGIELFVFASQDDWDNPDASHVRLVARLDNLGKGASGAAIQNLNIMCGLPETSGLRLTNPYTA